MVPLLFVSANLMIPIYTFFRTHLVHFNIFLLLVYIILSSSSIWIIYFSLEVSWIVLANLFIKGLYKGFFTYFIFNGLTGLLLLTGIIFILGNNSQAYYNLISYYYFGQIIFVFAVLCKIGFFPFFFIYMTVILNSPNIYLLLDILNKFIYFFILINIVLVVECVLVNLVICVVIATLICLIFLVKALVGIKYLILVSGFVNYSLLLLVLLIPLSSNTIYLWVYLTLYSLNSIIILWLLLFFNSLTTFIWDSLFSFNNLSLLFLLLLFIWFGFFPVFSFFFKFFSFTFFLINSFFSLSLLLIALFTFILQGYILRAVLIT